MKRTAMALCVVLLAGSGCTSYYRVTDPHTSKVYYTTKIDRKGSGAAMIKDGRTGNMVSIQNSEIEQISKEEYDAGRFTKTEEAEKPAPNPFK